MEQQSEKRHKLHPINIQNLVDEMNREACYCLSGGHFDKGCSTENVIPIMLD